MNEKFWQIDVSKRNLTVQDGKSFTTLRLLVVKGISDLLLFSKRNSKQRKIYLENMIVQIRIMNLYYNYVHLYM